MSVEEHYAVGIDIGGTFIKAGIVNGAGRILSKVSVDSRVDQGADAVVTATAEAAESAGQEAKLEWTQICAVGIGAPGLFDFEAGVLLSAPNLRCLDGKPLRAMVAEAIGTPHLKVALENDANAAALGEKWVGAGRSVRTLVLFTLGTGIGGGIILDGRPWHGSTGFGAELGHQTIVADGVRCGCGNSGCLEVYGSAPALIRHFEEAVKSGAKSKLAPAESVTARDLHEAALAGDAAAIQAFEETGRYLGIGAANVLNMLNPEMIVFVGGMTAAGDMLLEPIVSEAKRRAFKRSFEAARIVFGELGNDAGLVGAAACAFLADGSVSI